MGKSRIQLLREKWGRYLAGDVAWGRFTPQDLELALQAENHWRERFWSKHGQWLEATGLDRQLAEAVETQSLRDEVERLRYHSA
jgi:hypothetical protein